MVNQIPNSISESLVDQDPFIQFKIWYKQVTDSNISMPDAMVLATSTLNGFPSLRTVLLKSVDENGIIFFTNYLSRKGKELVENPQASLLFYWKELERQIRVEGRVEKVSRSESEDYFHSRPRESQIGAWVSNQSSGIPNREFLDNKFNELKKKFGNKEIPLPDYWGGYRLIPVYFEFWQGRENRLHDRICYKKIQNSWKIFRLAP